MSLEICPHCQDFTQQTELKNFKERRKTPYWVQSITKVSRCHVCEQTIEHENIQIENGLENMLIASQQIAC